LPGSWAAASRYSGLVGQREKIVRVRWQAAWLIDSLRKDRATLVLVVGLAWSLAGCGTSVHTAEQRGSTTTAAARPPTVAIATTVRRRLTLATCVRWWNRYGYASVLPGYAHHDQALVQAINLKRGSCGYWFPTYDPLKNRYVYFRVMATRPLPRPRSFVIVDNTPAISELPYCLSHGKLEITAFC
jgi:hypothetical protein